MDNPKHSRCTCSPIVGTGYNPGEGNRRTSRNGGHALGQYAVTIHVMLVEQVERDLACHWVDLLPVLTHENRFQQPPPMISGEVTHDGPRVERVLHADVLL
jgi:hypothetical protein